MTHAPSSGRARWDEALRSATLHAYNVLDTPRERDFDELAQMASDVCGTPIAVVNLVDTHRQFFKAEVGLGVRETPLETSFSGTAMLSADMMIVLDTTKDARLDGNPLVAGDPKLRFYAGALLTSPDGLPLGTMCVLDYVPRELTQQQIRTLKLLARQAMTQLELRRLMAEQKRALDIAQAAEREKTVLARIVEQSSDVIWMADAEGRAFFLNDAARQMLGPNGEIATMRIIDFVAHEDRQAVLDEVMPAVDARGDWEGELRVRNLESGEITPVLYNIFQLHDAAGDLVGYGAVAKDISVQKREQQRRADLTRELLHRMKNTLAMVQAIVTQTFRAANGDAAVKEAILGRLSALARAQDVLTVTAGDGADINEVLKTALAPHRSGQGRFSVSGPPVALAAPQALGLSLALHELATNAAKYGALSGNEGRVTIAWNVSEAAGIDFRWTETGGPPVHPSPKAGLGTRLIEQIVPSYFNGQATLNFDPAGIEFRLRGETSTTDIRSSLR